MSLTLAYATWLPGYLASWLPGYLAWLGPALPPPCGRRGSAANCSVYCQTPPARRRHRLTLNNRPAIDCVGPDRRRLEPQFKRRSFDVSTSFYQNKQLNPIATTQKLESATFFDFLKHLKTLQWNIILFYFHLCRNKKMCRSENGWFVAEVYFIIVCYRNAKTI